MSRHRKSSSRVFAFFALAAALALSLAPVLAIAHHHEGASSFAEDHSEPLKADFEADCALCGQLSLNDGRSLEGPLVFRLGPALELESDVAVTVEAHPAIPYRPRSIRSPPFTA